MLTAKQKEAFKKANKDTKYACAFVGIVSEKDKVYTYYNTACHAALSGDLSRSGRDEV